MERRIYSYLLSNILQYTGRMRDLINDLLLYSHLPTGSEQPLEEVDSHAVLQTAIFSIQSSMDSAGAQVYCDRLPKLQASSDLLLVFSNLLSNAIKYRGVDPPRIRISAQSEGDSWRFSVADNGIGIKPEYLERIFGIFRRLHGREIPGTGLGLAIAQKVIRFYRGRIWVESELGVGSTLFFTIPS